MTGDTRHTEVTRRIVRWAERQDHVRAVLLTSTRARPAATVDELSDYDVILYASDTTPLLEDDSWLSDLGPVLVRMPPKSQEHVWKFPTRLVLYEDGTRIDFSILPVAALHQAQAAPRLPDELDAGYLALLDKDDLAADLPAPTDSAYIPGPPTQEDLAALVEEFWWEATYVAKNLWRAELLPARYSLECVMKLDLLRRMLEWRIEIDHDWSLRPGVLGKGLRAYLASERWSELEATFVGADIDENWRALFRTLDLFRSVAVEVAQLLALTYPHRLDREVTHYLEQIRVLDADSGGMA